MFYENYYWGMNAIWWFIWAILFIWVFVTPYDIPFQRRKKISTLDVLHLQYKSGQITANQYHAMKDILKNERPV